MSASIFAAATHVGQVRTNNEDAWGSGDELWVVADGMGGHAGGEVASRMVVQRVLEAAPRDADALRDAFVAAHAGVVAAAEADDRLFGMGTTLVAAARATDRRVLVASVGDSRVYLLADGTMTAVTRDDNEAQQLLTDGVLTPEQARVHPGQFILTASIGAHTRAAVPSIDELPAAAGRLLLCTDGLNGELDDAAIAGLLADGTPEQAAARLVTAAVQAGGRDNVTVLVVDL